MKETLFAVLATEASISTNRHLQKDYERRTSRKPVVQVGPRSRQPGHIVLAGAGGEPDGLAELTAKTAFFFLFF